MPLSPIPISSGPSSCVTRPPAHPHHSPGSVLGGHADGAAGQAQRDRAEWYRPDRLKVRVQPGVPSAAQGR